MCAGLARTGFKKATGWYKVPADQADLFGALAFGGSTFLDVMLQEEAIALELRDGGYNPANLDIAQGAASDAQVRLSQVGMEYEVHPTNWPMCIRSPRDFVE